MSPVPVFPVSQGPWRPDPNEEIARHFGQEITQEDEKQADQHKDEIYRYHVAVQGDQIAVEVDQYEE